MGDLSVANYEIRFENEQERLNTFLENKWPNNAPVHRETLARAGFVYGGQDFTVQCFSCNLVCTDWKFGETAITKHRQMNPNCPFVQSHSDVFLDRSMTTVHHRPTGNDVVAEFHIAGVPEYTLVWPNHELLKKESERLKTFNDNWPHAFIRPEELARAGLVYLKSGDRVQCIFCYGIIIEWEQGDVPFQEHFRHFPNCPFVKGGKTLNISLKEEIRSQANENREMLQGRFDICGAAIFREFDICGSKPMDMNSFKPEREVVSPANDWDQLNIVEHTPPSYQSYATKGARLKTFENWPNNAPQYVQALVDAGFFYTGTSDHVKCFQCGKGLKNWEETDIPDEEHARWHPTCPFVLLNKGKDYIERTKKMKPPVFVETEMTCTQSTPLSRNENIITDMELDNLLLSDVAKVVLEMGMDRQKVRDAIRLRWQQVGYNFANAESLANAVLELNDFEIPR